MFCVQTAEASASLNPASKCVPVARPAQDQHRHPDGVRDLAAELEVVSLQRPVALHGRDQYLSGAQFLSAPRPLDRGEPGRFPGEGGEDLVRAVFVPPDVDGENDALRAVGFGDLRDQLGPVQRARVDHHLVGALRHEVPDVVECPDAASRRQGHEALPREAPDDPKEIPAAALSGTGDIEHHDFVDGPGIDEIQRVPVVRREQLGAKEDAVVEREHGDDPLAQHGQACPRKLRRSERPASWLFSGWNWVPKTLPRSKAATKQVPYSHVPTTQVGSACMQ